MAKQIEMIDQQPCSETDRSSGLRDERTARRHNFGLHWLRNTFSRSSRPTTRCNSTGNLCLQSGHINNDRRAVSNEVTSNCDGTKRRSWWRYKRRQLYAENLECFEDHAHGDRQLASPENMHQKHGRISWRSFKNSMKRLRNRSGQSSRNNHVETNITVNIDGERLEDSPVLQRASSGALSTDNTVNCEKSDSGCLKLHKREEYCIPRMLSKVIKCPWYWGNIDCFEAASALHTRMDGFFLLRKSAHPDFLFTISYKRSGKTRHVRVESSYAEWDNDDYDIEGGVWPWINNSPFSPTYSQLLKLIDVFSKPYDISIYNMPLLICPLNRTDPLSLKELARAEVYSMYDYSAIESMDVPEDLRLYAKEYQYNITDLPTPPV
eukprot:gene17646-19401_t